MSRVLIVQSIRDSWALLVACSALTTGFVWLRIWIASKIKFETFFKIFAEGLKFFQSLLPVPFEELASPLGRVAFSYEELPVMLLGGLWTVARGSECLAGRQGDGTMEMLLAQPVRRLSVVMSHTLVTLIGVAALGMSSWIGVAAGLAVSQFESPPALSALLPAVINYMALAALLVGLSTLASAFARTRAQAVAIVISVYVIELALLIVSRISESAAWLGKFTILSTYDPTLLSLRIDSMPDDYWPVLWSNVGWLCGVGAALWIAAAAYFCRRDLPAPL